MLRFLSHATHLGKTPLFALLDSLSRAISARSLSLSIFAACEIEHDQEMDVMRW